MKTLYQIQGTVIHHTTDLAGVSTQVVVQVPTFFLDADIQGIVDSAHAVNIAKGIVCPVELEYEHTEANLTATPVRMFVENFVRARCRVDKHGPFIIFPDRVKDDGQVLVITERGHSMSRDLRKEILNSRSATPEETQKLKLVARQFGFPNIEII